MSRRGSRPDEQTRRAARSLALAFAIGLPPTLLGQLVFVPASNVALVMGLTLCVVAAAIVALLMVSARGPWRLLVAPVVVLLDVTAILCAAVLPIGLDIAVIIPFLAAVLLVAVADGWELGAGLAAAWLSGVVGSALARANPELSAIPHVTPVPFAVAMVAIGTAIGYSILGWAAAHWQAAIAEKDGAMEVARVAQMAQQRAVERLRALVDNSPVPTLAFDSAGVIHAWSPAAERLLGWSAAEAIGKRVEDLVPEEVRKGVRPRIGRAMDGHLAGTRPTLFLRKDGSQARAEVYDGIERDVDGRPIGVVVQFLDLTEREAMAARLVEAQRLEAVGQLAGGVAHDFNNSLTAIAGFASLIASGDSPDPRGDARTILNAADHAATLTRQLLAFSRRVPLRPQLIDLCEFLHGVEPLVRSLVGETIHVRIETDRRPALVKVDPPSLEQAVLNLTANARDAMPQGGKLTLAVRSYSDCPADGSSETAPHIALCVSDTGSGISDGDIGRVFEPFFTTKPPGKGTGLGLAMVHGFTAQSGGHVVVSSPPGQGAILELHFPRAEGVLLPERSRSEPIGGTDSILFVEDDPSVAAFGMACLRRLGYDVTPAMNGSDAVALTASRLKPFDLLLTDIVLPGMSGPELAALIHRQHPATAILFASGYSAESLTEDDPGFEVPLLEKPYSQTQLAAKVRSVLDRRRVPDTEPEADR